MRKHNPPAQGLYHPSFEHDACGIGFVVHMKGVKSHQIVKDSLTVLKNLSHRGACGCEENTGDGAGILIQIPHKFLQKVCAKKSIELPKPGDYGVGMMFLTPHAEKRNMAEEIIERIVTEEGCKVLGWRAVPTCDDSLGKTARTVAPVVRQILIQKSDKTEAGIAFERKLFVIRKRMEREMLQEDDIDEERFFVVSLSSRTLIYKGMLLSEQVEQFYPDLLDRDMESSIALVHSRFATNTFPNWDRAHPNRYMIHNGEINTLRGNFNWMTAREANLATDVFGTDVDKVKPVLVEDGSDSAIFDNCLEFLVLGGRSLSHAMMMMIPEPWNYHETMDDARKAFYEYHSCLMEPWDGPAAIAASDGIDVVAALDRNGLRPARYWITKDDRVILASEVGVLDIPQSDILKKGRLEPGRMFRIDTRLGRIVTDEEIKSELASAQPYRKWLNENLIKLPTIPSKEASPSFTSDVLVAQQEAFGYTYEEKQRMIGPMVTEGKDPLGSMGVDIPLAVLSDKPRLIYDYFKQLFAQVTNPPIDAIREEIVTASDSLLGAEGNILHPDASNCQMLRLDHPLLTNQEMANLKGIHHRNLKSMVLPIHFKPAGGHQALEEAMRLLCQQADRAIDAGFNILILSDRGVTENKAPIPALLAVSGLHHHLIRSGRRTRTGLVIETGEAREVHHFCLLLGYGAGAINPYLALDTIKGMITEGMITGFAYEKAEYTYIKSAVKGIIKVISKMGISTIASYRGAQIFEAIGLKKELIDKYFCWTVSRVEGVGLPIITEEVLMRHSRAFQERGDSSDVLDVGGKIQWRADGEFHLFNPQTIHLLQRACRENSSDLYKRYSSEINEFDKNHSTLRSLLDFKFAKTPVPIEEVESVESICKRFKTGAMSYGSISEEAHATLAVAMNRIGGRSNTGEGGEDPKRFTPLPNGDSQRSSIKQVASGRFGVTSHYLVNADEIQIKMAQGAKPGEGGQLPGKKVYPWVAKVRNSTPGVELISPPPHHDIYSIEDLAELIHDLKNANPRARINVKLVSEAGVGTIAAGVAKGHADVVLISGHDGGTGASPLTSTHHAGLPWELGLAETHQTLVINDLRSRIVVETDGQMKTGRDVAIAALLGAEEFGFATAPLVVMGCIMMRKCHLGTCPVGVATQTPELREKFSGDAAHVVNFMHFIAGEVREIMAKLGFRKLEELVGRVDKLAAKEAIEHWKAKGVDLSKLLHEPDVSDIVGRHCTMSQNHGLDGSLDSTQLLQICKNAIEKKEKVKANVSIKNVNRVVGTITGSEITRIHGADGLPEDTIELNFNGSAGQSFGAFVPKGMTLCLEGDANDYIGKGLSGGKIAVYPPKDAGFVPEHNVIIGNVALYGATSGEAYIRGLAGERFAVRNSGVLAVVEGVGDHGCEYMTGGRVIILGPTGRNFAAGMSGGIAYVYNPKGDFESKLNKGMVALETISSEQDEEEILGMLRAHQSYTGSTVAAYILKNWAMARTQFVKVMPKDYKRVLQATERVKATGLTGDELLLAAFHESLAA